MAINDIVIAISGAKGDTRRYRTFHLFEQLQLFGAKSAILHITDLKLSEKLDRATLVILHRISIDRYVESLLKMTALQKRLDKTRPNYTLLKRRKV